MQIKNKILSLAVLVLILGGMLAGCAPKAGPVSTEGAAEIAVEVSEPGITVIDALGRTLTFEQAPEHILVAGKATALLVNTLYMFPEAASRIVAIENRAQKPDAFISEVDPGYSAKLTLEKNAGAEAISPLKPDVVILKTSMQSSLGEPLEQLGIQVFYLDLETPDAFYRDVRSIGTLFGNDARAEEIVAYYLGKVESVSSALMDLKPEDKPTVLLLQHALADNVVSFSVPPASYLQTIVTEIAGGIPVWKDSNTGNGWQVVTLDQIAAWNPMVIGIIDYSGGALDALDAIQADPTWQNLDAVRQGHVSAFPVDYLSWDQPDPRWILGLVWEAASIHPEYFPAFNLQAEIVNFYHTLYGLDDATISAKALPLLKGSFPNDGSKIAPQ